MGRHQGKQAKHIARFGERPGETRRKMNSAAEIEFAGWLALSLDFRGHCAD